MSKYIIWDKVSDVITPVGEILTPEEWMERYPVAKVPSLDLVVAGDSAINGAFCQEYTSFVALYENSGCDFTGCTSKQDFLDAVEAFENQRNEEAANYIDPQERIAAATEAQLLIAMENSAADI